MDGSKEINWLYDYQIQNSGSIFCFYPCCPTPTPWISPPTPPNPSNSKPNSRTAVTVNNKNSDD